MGFDYTLCNRQSKAGSEFGRGFRLPVAVEHVVEMLGRDPRAGIGDGELDDVGFVTGEDFYLPAFRRELDRVADEVGKNLKHPLAIRRYHDRMLGRRTCNSE